MHSALYPMHASAAAALSVLWQLYRVWTGVQLVEYITLQWVPPNAFGSGKKRGTTEAAAVMLPLLFQHFEVADNLFIYRWQSSKCALVHASVQSCLLAPGTIGDHTTSHMGGLLETSRPFWTSLANSAKMRFDANHGLMLMGRPGQRYPFANHQLALQTRGKA